MNSEIISITSIGSISPLGSNSNNIWHNYKLNKHFIGAQTTDDKAIQFQAPIPVYLRDEIAELRISNSRYKNLDDSVLFAIYAARNAYIDAGWKSGDIFGINIGSSRGATSLFEKYHQDFLNHKRGSTLSSPTTTLGNISSWVAQDLQSNGPDISHSITCSTALHAMLNGVAWLKSGMCDKFLVGGSEAALTPFTIAQMKALKIYAKETSDYPCRALDLNKTKNSMVLGEGASMACLEKGEKTHALAYISGLGYATEVLTHNTSISTHAECFQKSMSMALEGKESKQIDAIVMHAPGTVKGDLSEFNAIKKIFGSDMPALTTNKWKIGHTFGASGMLSVEMAVLMLQKQHFIKVPYVENQKMPKKLQNILINAVGFGGNAVSILLSKDI